MACYDAKNPAALATLRGARNVRLAPFSGAVMQAAEASTFELINEFAASDSDFVSILKQWSAFRNSIRQWHSLAEKAYLTYDADSGNPRRWLLDGGSLIRIALKGPMSEQCLALLMDFALAEDGLRFGNSNLPDELVAHHFASSMISLGLWWLEHDIPFPPGQMDEYIQQLVLEPLRKLQQT